MHTHKGHHTCTIVDCIEEVCCVSAVASLLPVCATEADSPLTGLVAELFLFKQDVWYLGDGRHTGVTHCAVRSWNNAQTELNVFVAFWSSDEQRGRALNGARVFCTTPLPGR